MTSILLCVFRLMIIVYHVYFLLADPTTFRYISLFNFVLFFTVFLCPPPFFPNSQPWIDPPLPQFVVLTLCLQECQIGL